MTLFEWEVKTGVYVGSHDSGARWVPGSTLRMTDTARRRLWHLDDYLVSSVMGGTIWLVRRRPSGVTS